MESVTIKVDKRELEFTYYCLGRLLEFIESPTVKNLKYFCEYDKEAIRKAKCTYWELYQTLTKDE